MTLEQAKKDKVMVVNGTITGEICICTLWEVVRLVEHLKLSYVKDGVRGLYYRGPWELGLYVLGKVVEMVRSEDAKCHLEITCQFE